MGEFFFMISTYDDYLIDTPGVKERLNIAEYQPGDTLRIMAPFYLACYSETELLSLARQNLGLLPGCSELMKILRKEWDIFVISTSYTQFAHTVTSALSIPQDHVYCTDLNIDKLKMEVDNIKSSVDILVHQIFNKYLKNNKNIESVLEELNDFFWKNEDSNYIQIMNKIEVRGGKRKELAIENISKRTNTPISKMIALGDSITDINMLQRLKKERGISISFNGNDYTVSRANIAITTPNNLGVLPVFESYDRIDEFLKNWDNNYPNFKDNPESITKGLISKECKELFIKHGFVPKITDLKTKSGEELQSIINEQKEMRKRVRGWAGELG